jgi:hypothetical protein
MGTVTDDCYSLDRIKFFLALLLQIPSIILCLFVVAFFIINRTVLRNLQHKALLFLIIINFIQLTFDLPLVIHFFRLGVVSPATSTYCKWWVYLGSTLDAANEFLMTTISVQRHTLVFQPNILHIRVKRYLLYYLPLLLSVLYPIVFYMGAVVFYPCDTTQWNFKLNICGDTTCFLSHNQILATFDWIVNTAFPIAIIILANIVLVIKVIKQQYRRQRVITWSKQRRMTLQLLSMSSLYLVTWLPNGAALTPLQKLTKVSISI